MLTRAKIPPKLGQGFEGERSSSFQKSPFRSFLRQFSVTQLRVLQGRQKMIKFQGCMYQGQKPFWSSSMWGLFLQKHVKNLQKSLLTNSDGHVQELSLFRESTTISFLIKASFGSRSFFFSSVNSSIIDADKQAKKVHFSFFFDFCEIRQSTKVCLEEFADDEKVAFNEP